MRAFRYRELLFVVVLIALVIWLFAPPAKEVTLPNAAVVTPTPSFPWDNLTPGWSENKVVSPQSRLQSLTDPRGFAYDWSDRDPSQFSLTLAIRAGKTPQTTHFDVAYRGPEGYEIVNFWLVDAEDGGVLYPRIKTGDVDQGQWTFTGAQLRSPAEPSQVPEHRPLRKSESPLPGVLRTGKWLIRASVLSPSEKIQLSRRVNLMTLESAPFELEVPYQVRPEPIERPKPRRRGVPGKMTRY